MGDYEIKIKKPQTQDVPPKTTSSEDVKQIDVFNKTEDPEVKTGGEEKIFNFTTEEKNVMGFVKQTPPEGPPATASANPSETPPEGKPEEPPTKASYKPSENSKELTLTYGQTKDGKTYTNAVVQPGESPQSLANTFNTDVKEVKTMNKSVLHKTGNTEYFLAGQEVKIPGEVKPDETNYKNLVNRKTSEEIKKEDNQNAYNNAEPYNGPVKSYVAKKGDSYYKISLNSLQESGSKRNITEQAISNRMVQIQKLNNNKPVIVNKPVIAPSNDKKDIEKDAETKFVNIYRGLKYGEKPEEISKNIKGINPQTAELVFAYYDAYSDSTIIEDILNTKSLDSKTKEECLKHFVGEVEQHAKDNDKLSADVMKNLAPLVKNYSKDTPLIDIKRMGVDVRKLVDRKDTLNYQVPVSNGLIDKNFSQGNTGDCWLLAGVKAMTTTSQGQQIVNNSIKQNSDGSVTVTLKGVNKTYKVSAQEIKGSNNLSTGDGDLRALEIATDKYFRENVPSGKADITGNTCGKAFEVLVGKDKVTTYSKAQIPAVLDKIKTQKSNKAAVTGIGGASEDPKDIDATVNGQQVHIYSSHAYTISKVDDKNVYLINPHDSQYTIKMKKADYLKYFNLMSVLEF